MRSPLAFFAMLLWEKSRRQLPVYQKHCRRHREFTAACVVGVLGAINCEYRQTFMFAMCGIVTFLVIFTLAGLNYITPFHIFHLHFLSINAFIQSLHISTCTNYAY